MSDIVERLCELIELEEYQEVLVPLYEQAAREAADEIERLRLSHLETEKEIERLRVDLLTARCEAEDMSGKIHHLRCLLVEVGEQHRKLAGLVRGAQVPLGANDALDAIERCVREALGE